MYKIEPVLKNVTHKILSDFELETDHLILACYRTIINRKRICHLLKFAVPVDLGMKMKESEKNKPMCLKIVSREILGQIRKKKKNVKFLESVMVWSCTSGNGVGKIDFLKRFINTAVNPNVLNHYLIYWEWI